MKTNRENDPSPYGCPTPLSTLLNKTLNLCTTRNRKNGLSHGLWAKL